jgi:hypothetical protein
MEWKLTEDRYNQYNQAMQSAQEAESNIGSLTYKVFQLNRMRREIDMSLKTWWDEVLVEMKLEKDRNYMISRDGVIQEVTPNGKPAASPTVEAPKAPESVEGCSVNDLK